MGEPQMSTIFEHAGAPASIRPPFPGKTKGLFPPRRTAVFKEQGVCLGLPIPMQSEDVFRAHLALIDTIIDRVCRRSRFAGADAEDFRSAVNVAVIENDYALLRNAAERSSLPAYLTVVIQ